MKDNKTLEKLNKKWWYRMIKVIFVTSFTLVNLLGVFILLIEYEPYQTIDYYKTTIACKLGEQQSFSLSEFNEASAIDSLSVTKRNELGKEIFKRCGYYSFPETKQQEMIKEWNEDRIKPIVIEKSYKTIGGWDKFVIALIIMLGSSVLLLEILRRIFYYIYLGKFFPKKI